MDIHDKIRKWLKRLEKIQDLEENFAYIKESFEKGKKIALCCVIIDEDDKTTDRMYLISDEVEGARMLGETELWKKDLIDNFVLGKGEINMYKDYRDEKDDK